MYDLLIIGAGPAGITAGIYAKRAGLKVGLIEKGTPGGQLVNTKEVANYTGFTTQSGADIAVSMFTHAMDIGIEFLYENVIEVVKGETHKVVTEKQTIDTKSIIIATGTPAKTIKAKNTDKFAGSGISWCATCDGAFFKGEDVVVIGNNTNAFEESLFLTDLCKSVTVIDNGKEINCEKKYLDIFNSKDNTKIINNAFVTSFEGTDKLDTIEYLDTKTKEKKTIKASAAFIYIGNVPMTTMVKELNITNDKGYIVTNEKMETSVEGIYAAGDVRDKQVRQIVTATGDGCIAYQNALNYVKTLNK